jgi:hypothetical protein
LVRARFGLQGRAGPPSDLPMHARRLPPSPPAFARRSARCSGGRAPSAGVAQLAEHLFCKQVVGGSSPPASSTFSVYLGGLPERPKGAGCKPAGIAYVGSNPTPSTGFSAFSAGRKVSRRSRQVREIRRSRRFVVRVAAALADVDLSFQDSPVAGRVGTSRGPTVTEAREGLLGASRALNTSSAIARGALLDQNSGPSSHRGSSSTGRASAFQAERRGFESLLPLYGALAAQRIGWPT